MLEAAVANRCGFKTDPVFGPYGVAACPDISYSLANLLLSQRFSTAPSPILFNSEVSIVPSVIRKIPGNLPSHALLAAGMYCRELASIAATPGTWAARLADWIKDAPGQVRPCTQRNNLCFPATDAIST